MKNIWLGTLALLMSCPSFAQNMQDLQRQLAEKNIEIKRLRQRVEQLEREITPHRIKQTQPHQAAAENADQDSNRALERALVREGSLLLSPKTVEIETNFVYSHANNSSFRRDSYGPGLALRAGLPWHSQIELAVPYVFERRQSGTTSHSSSGIGDVTLGIAHQFLSERASLPSLIGAVNYTASTGKNTVFESATPVAHGGGFNAMQASLTALKRIDPLVFFGSYSMTHIFARSKNGIDVDPGNSHGLRFGTALATGPDTSLRAAFNLNYFEKTKIGGNKVAGSDDPFSLIEFGSSSVLSESTALDVLIGAGLTRNAPKFRILIALPIRF